MPDSATNLAVRLRDALCRQNQRLVLAESCTAGRIAATLGTLPGISAWLCGSFVVYRCDSKTKWLGIPPELLADPAIGPVSRQVTALLASSALDHTPEADVALAVTGDIGPGASDATDGIVFMALQRRSETVMHEQQIHLHAPAPRDANDIAGRLRRLEEATERVLAFAVDVVES
jgi:PncC family amidohydrolase